MQEDGTIRDFPSSTVFFIHRSEINNQIFVDFCTMSKKAVLYCRVDRGASAENAHFAIEHQIAYLTRFAEKHHYTVIDIYSDIGLPGHDLTRPELNRMKQAAEKGMFDAIFVVNRDRLFRGRWTEAPMFPVPIIVADEVRMKRKEEHLH